MQHAVNLHSFYSAWVKLNLDSCCLLPRAFSFCAGIVKFIVFLIHRQNARKIGAESVDVAQ